ncbi:hypothetical protein [Rhizobium phaseoli]|uniref:Uncharacterized protein n=1 Tax=Rhizobium phaseoli TaxID=396 RepID=A0ABM6CFP0_9HYPH|nr:hypothetical protein [Rhizobium phaseoli]ANL87100.1 hypothetical protein AMC81_PA00079 [Rhizobium phaseoli]ANL93609.1 hypothetical protein AMC80_PA00079 [Rhizobium phaseoli]
MSMRMYSCWSALFFAATVLSSPTTAEAQSSRGIETRGCSNCSSSSGGNSSSGAVRRNNNAAIIGAGVGLLLQGLANAQADDDDGAEDRARYQARMRQAEKDAVASENAATKSDLANPWANKGGKKKPKTDDLATYADKSCADFKVAGSGVSWDYTKISNRCSFPIKVLTCYYDKGEGSKCGTYKAGQWGQSDTIKPYASTAGVSSSKRPGFGVRYIVCNMSAGPYQSCIHPQSLCKTRGICTQ